MAIEAPGSYLTAMTRSSFFGYFRAFGWLAKSCNYGKQKPNVQSMGQRDMRWEVETCSRLSVDLKEDAARELPPLDDHV